MVQLDGVVTTKPSSTPKKEVSRVEYHPSIAAVLRHFRFNHLPEPLQEASRPFAALAVSVADSCSGPEATVALRKLLEAKDAAVRAARGDADGDAGIEAQAVAESVHKTAVHQGSVLNVGDYARPTKRTEKG